MLLLPPLLSASEELLCCCAALCWPRHLLCHPLLLPHPHPIPLAGIPFPSAAACTGGHCPQTFFVRLGSREDEERFIERVIVRLHPTFHPPTVVLQGGWGWGVPGV